MEAGIEHLGRATAKAVDKLIVVVEPGRRSIETAGNIRKLASEIGLDHITLIGNKIRNDSDEAYLREHLPGFEFLGFLSLVPDIPSVGAKFRRFENKEASSSNDSTICLLSCPPLKNPKHPISNLSKCCQNPNPSSPS